MKKKAFIPLILFMLAAAVSVSAEEGRKVAAIPVFTSGSAASLTSDQGWTVIAPIRAADLERLPAAEPGTIRKWRMIAVYSEDNLSGQSTIQIKLTSSSPEDPVFTLPWTEGRVSWSSAASNWHLSNEQGLLLSGDALCEARFITPPRVSAPGEIHSLTLEAWDIPVTYIRTESPSTSTEADRNLAAGPILPELRAIQRDPFTGENVEINESAPSAEKDAALHFSLTFVKNYLAGEKIGFFQMLNNQIYAIASDQYRSKYQVTPPEADPAGHTLSDYRDHYNFRLYSYDEYKDIFPEWTDGSRRWHPDRETYLFMGGEVKRGEEPFSDDRFFVFLVKKIDGSWKVVARPE